MWNVWIIEGFLPFFVYDIAYFLGVFAKLQKAATSFIMSFCPSACQHGTAWFLLDLFL